MSRSGTPSADLGKSGSVGSDSGFSDSANGAQTTPHDPDGALPAYSASLLASVTNVSHSAAFMCHTVPVVPAPRVASRQV